MEIINGYTISWLIFSVALAIIPFVASHVLYVDQKNFAITLKKIVLFFVWIVMFPNIPYLFTKGRYLIGYCESSSPWELCGNSWAIGFFFLHSFIAVPILYLSIREMGDVLQKRWVKIQHWHLAFIMLALSAIVLPVGLYGRFNSWNLFHQPMTIFFQFWGHIDHYGLGEIVIWFTIYMAVYAITHYFVTSVARQFALRAPKDIKEIKASH